ncbi:MULTISPECIES: uroporphyrinogen-III synthase [unclassified Arthrobacter]|uniref:uroporphyrinogen-III synthase n=1 Tax=unclassified Arthrobacter TaxID=235627 RepID=UPI001491C129|nr:MULTISPECIES: uroporphyrinogen-III synthase [unclassified Arthrobacter]MBE0008734.1 uroporphyrinogen-III synthase [Arthrobacter sp. AET 35A]NOJ62567.1 uroporphyrinogen-III synthase [Arthrobacter sp. 147(2020)]
MTPAPASGALPLDGVSTVLLRGADQAGPIVGELALRGATVKLLPLIDFEIPDDTGPLDAALHRLQSGGFSWLVVTSSTTVRALKQRSAHLGLDLPGGLPRHTRVAAVGEATASALAAEGYRVDLVPGRTGQESAASGLAAALRTLPPEGQVLLPQADLAADTLERSLSGQGWDVHRVIAYLTVAYPAAPGRRLTTLVPPEAERDAPTSAATSAPTELDPAGFWAAVADGAVDAVVFTSPSTVRRLGEQKPKPSGANFPAGLAAVMIGASTAAEAVRWGIPVAAVAEEPTPAGIADAVAAAVRDHP